MALLISVRAEEVAAFSGGTIRASGTDAHPAPRSANADRASRVPIQKPSVPLSGWYFMITCSFTALMQGPVVVTGDASIVGGGLYRPLQLLFAPIDSHSVKGLECRYDFTQQLDEFSRLALYR